MCSQQRKGAALYEIITYTLPQLHTKKSWYIDFRCYDPIAQEMKRKKFSLDGIAKISERKKRAAEIMVNLTNRLRSGWNPWAEATNSRQYTKFCNIHEIYVKYLLKLCSAKTIKDSTYTDYMKHP